MTAEPPTKFRTSLTSFGLRATLSLSLAACLTLVPASAQAQSASDSATAQALSERAKKLIADGKYLDACPMLEESERIDPRSGTLLNLADCYEHTGRLASAWSTFLEAATSAKASGNAERESGARQRAAALVPKLSNLVVTAPFAASTPGLEITRDGERVGNAQLGLPLPADAGKHTIAAKAPGRKPWQTEVTFQDGAGTANVAVPDLESGGAAAPAGAAVSVPGTVTSTQSSQSAAPTPTEPAADGGAPSRVNGGVIAGSVVTGVLVVGTIVTSVLYSSKLHDYNTANDNLASNAASLSSQTKTLGAVNMALLGGTVVAAGVTVYLLARPRSEQVPTSARLELRGTVSPGLAGLSLGGSL